jgi:methionine-gamma-lyase
MKSPRRDTLMVHGTHTRHTTSMDLVPPIHLTSTFRFRDVDHGAGIFDGTEDGYVYTRIGNPTVDLLQEKLAAIEGAEDAVAAGSGMAAIASVALTLARPGDNIVSCTTVYGGTYALFRHHLAAFDIEVRFISPADCCAADQVRVRVDDRTRLLFIETPANPTLDVIDIGLFARVAAERGIPLVVDNTFASPYLQSPLALGAGIVVHSATKYLSGHGDIIGGMIVGSKEMMDRIRSSYAHHFGPVMSPFNAWLFLRGIKTLALRMTRHSDSALKIAQWLETHPKIHRVHYPGLPSHPGHALAQQQMRGFGGMIAFEVAGGIDAGRRVMNGVRLCILAVSLGDCESLIQHPASMTHATYTSEERAAAGIADGLIRLSVGLEDPDDIIEDLEGALVGV